MVEKNKNPPAKLVDFCTIKPPDSLGVLWYKKRAK